MGAILECLLSARPCDVTLTPNVKVQAFLCLDCGNIELVGDVKKAEALVGGSNPK